jgi:hypothetical protein
MCDQHHDDIWVSIPVGAALHERYKVAMSLKELVRETNTFSVKNVPGCSATLKESNPKEMYLKYNVKCTLKSSDPAGHDVKVRFDYWAINEKSSVDNLDVNCSCSCPAFLYWGAQWNLHKKDSLEGEPRPELVAPTERLEDRNGFLICKHIKVVLDRVIPSVARVINDVKRKNQVEQFKKKEEFEKEMERRKEEVRKRREEEREERKKRKPRPQDGYIDSPRNPKPKTKKKDDDEVPEENPKVKSYGGPKKKDPEEDEVPRTESIKPTWKPKPRSGVID